MRKQQRKCFIKGTKATPAQVRVDKMSVELCGSIDDDDNGEQANAIVCA